jgi:hypothetical protein
MAGPNDITIHIEGHVGHRGNPLAHALVAKLRLLLTALSRAERCYGERGRRQTDYEVTDIGKRNPAHFTLHPVPRVANYDPIPAFNWTVEQLESVAVGRNVDDRVDALLARTFAEISERKHEDDYSKLWLSVNGQTIELDDQFHARSTVLAAVKTERERLAPWFEGVSYGSVVGDLREVSDIDGEHRFVIIPPVGAARIDCVFPESERERMRDYLFRTVRVTGRIRYAESSPFPIAIDMDHIEFASEFVEPPHLLELRGVFKDAPRGQDDLGDFLDEL